VIRLSLLGDVHLFDVVGLLGALDVALASLGVGGRATPARAAWSAGGGVPDWSPADRARSRTDDHIR